jgi:hypothetical protein
MNFHIAKSRDSHPFDLKGIGATTLAMGGGTGNNDNCVSFVCQPAPLYLIDRNSNDVVGFLYYFGQCTLHTPGQGQSPLHFGRFSQG